MNPYSAFLPPTNTLSPSVRAAVKYHESELICVPGYSSHAPSVGHEYKETKHDIQWQEEVECQAVVC